MSEGGISKPSDQNEVESRLVETITSPETEADVSLEAVEGKSFPEIVEERRRTTPEDPAVRWKHLGIWQEYTWTEYYEKMELFALGLETYGFESGDVIFTMGYNRPQHLWAWLGAHCLGGIAGPMYQTATADEIGPQLDILEPRIVYAENQEVVDKVLAAIDEDSSVEVIIYRDKKGMFRYEDHENLEIVSYEHVESRGRKRRESVGSKYIKDKIFSLNWEATAMVPPTSGTTGTPKRVKLAASNLLVQAEIATQINPAPPGSDYFSFITMAWGGEQMMLLGAAIASNWVINFPEQPETEDEDFREIGPEIIFGSPGTYEARVAEVKAQIENTSRLKRWVYDKAMAIGRLASAYRIGEETADEAPLRIRTLNKLAYWTVHRPLLDHMGLKQARHVFTGGGPLGQEHFEFYHSLGVPLKQIWGQTECGGYITVHRDENVQPDTTGQPIPFSTVGRTGLGELVVRGRMVSEGYYKQPEKTAETFEDGWLFTDDFGKITEDGHVKVVDRLDDVIELNDGTTVAPISIETTIKFDPYIKEAMVIGDQRNELIAILNIRFDNVAEWADQRDIQYQGYRDLSQKSEVLELLRSVVVKANEEADDINIQRFVSLFKEFHPDDKELTRTGKLRREVVIDKYEDLIQQMYADAERANIETTITYQDGREAVEEAEMEIVTVNGAGGD